MPCYICYCRRLRARIQHWCTNPDDGGNGGTKAAPHADGIELQQSQRTPDHKPRLPEREDWPHPGVRTPAPPPVLPTTTASHHGNRAFAAAAPIFHIAGCVCCSLGCSILLFVALASKFNPSSACRVWATEFGNVNRRHLLEDCNQERRAEQLKARHVPSIAQYDVVLAVSHCAHLTLRSREKIALPSVLLLILFIYLLGEGGSGGLNNNAAAAAATAAATTTTTTTEPAAEQQQHQHTCTPFVRTGCTRSPT